MRISVGALVFVRPSRRAFLNSATAKPAFSMLGVPAVANLSVPVVPTRRFSFFSMGDAQLTVMSNGELSHRKTENNVNADDAQVRRLLYKAATDRVAMLGHRVPLPGVGHEMKYDQGRSFVPTLWQVDYNDRKFA